MAEVMAKRERKPWSAWQPIETAPKERVGPHLYENHGPTILLGFAGTNAIKTGRWEWHQNGRTGNWKCEGRVTFQKPTHWMPLPEPPK
jgi:hypothetical protein